MLKVSTAARPSVKVNLPEGAEITFKPAGSGGVLAAQAAYALVVQSGGDVADALVAFTGAFAAWGVESWSGIGDETGTPLDLPPAGPSRLELVDLLLTQDPVAFDRVDAEYVTPFLLREAEKNGSAPSPAGDTPAGALTEN